MFPRNIPMYVNCSINVFPEYSLRKNTKSLEKQVKNVENMERTAKEKILRRECVQRGENSFKKKKLDRVVLSLDGKRAKKHSSHSFGTVQQ